MKAFLVFFMFVICCGFSCRNEDECSYFRIDEEAVFRKGTEYCASNASLRFSISNIQDSRCPEGVVCVWQGEVNVILNVYNYSESEVVLKSVHQPSDTVGVYVFSLVQVDPYPRYKHPVETDDYRVTLKIYHLN